MELTSARSLQLPEGHLGLREGYAGHQGGAQGADQAVAILRPLQISPRPKTPGRPSGATPQKRGSASYGGTLRLPLRQGCGVPDSERHESFSPSLLSPSPRPDGAASGRCQGSQGTLREGLVYAAYVVLLV